MKHIHTL